jgi:hypothetical protein
MRKLTLFLVALVGVVLAAPAVAQAPPSVTLTIGDPGTGAQGTVTTARYGELVELSGEVNVAQGNELIEILVTPYRGQTTTKLVRTQPDGEFVTTHRPTIRTSYIARWQGASSVQEPFAFVRPDVTLRVRNARLGRFAVSMRATRAHASRVVWFQRRTSRTSWKTVKRVRLRGTAMSASFTARLPRGVHRVRAFVPQTPGYLRATSDFVLVRR